MELPLEEVIEAYFDCRKNKRRTYNALRFEIDYEDNCVQLWEELNNRTYKIGKSITFIVTNPKPREIFAADFRDRVVHHLVVRKLEPLFEKVFIEDTYNCRKGKGTLYGVIRLQNKIRDISNNFTEDCYIAKFDMQGFFMSIHKPTLNKMLQDFIDKNYFEEDKELIKWLVEMIVLHCPEKNCIRKSPKSKWKLIDKSKSLFYNGDEYGLAIGNLTSQMFANFYYLHHFDRKMVKTFEGYGRYVDDFYVIDKDKNHILSKIDSIKSYLYDELQIKLHPDKFYLQHYSKGIKFTGMVVKESRTYIGNRTRSNFIRKVRNFIPNEEDVEKFTSSINSYLGYCSHHRSFNIKQEIINEISPIWWKYCCYTSGIRKVKINNSFKNKQICLE